MRHCLVEQRLAPVDAPELLAARDHEHLELPLDVDENGFGPPTRRFVGEPVEPWLFRELILPLMRLDPLRDGDEELLESVGHAHSVGGLGLYVQRQRANKVPF